MIKQEQLLINILEEVTRRFNILLEENKRLLEEVSFKATHDILTNLYNRDFFEKMVNKLILEKKEFCLIFMDLDNFKYVNDTHGHKTGDMILIRVAKIIKYFLKGKDLVARFGGDEFVIAIVDCRKKEALRIMEQIRNEIKGTLKKYNITSSIGIACFPQDGDNYETLVKLADKKMYKAKEKKDMIAV